MLTQDALINFKGMTLPYMEAQQEIQFCKLVVELYNKNRRWFTPKVTLEEVSGILFDNRVSHKVSTSEIILIARALCTVASVVCPFVNKAKSDE